jgi:MoaA/NifB/PqqE/SkfB family radical SAM enzyme
MADSDPSDTISWENIIYLADFLIGSKDHHLALLGGEPTLHPKFVDIVLYLIERGFHITVFTSGVMSEERLEELKFHLTKIPLEEIQFVCNLNDPEQTGAPKEEIDKVHGFLASMGPWTTPGFNIYRTDFDLHFIFDCIARFGMQKSLRVGLSSPIAKQNNLYIRNEEMKEIVDRLYGFREQFEKLRVRPNLDCGFPLCDFTNEQLGWFFRMSGGIHFGCGPAIDIKPNMDVYSCFPLSNIQKRSLFEFNSIQEVAAFYVNLHNQIRQDIPGVFDKCYTCIFRSEGRCSGGGVCHILKNVADEGSNSHMSV